MARPEAVIPGALRELLSRSVDYAGLFPPASLDVATAAANYARYRGGPDAWMLGKFIVPAGSLRQLVAEKARLAANDRWPLAVLLGSDVAEDLSTISSLSAANRQQIAVEVVEAKASGAEAINQLAAHVPAGCRLVVEIPIDDDPGSLVQAVVHAGAVAKARTGGVTPGAFPRSTAVLRFIRRCVESKASFKLTAGLHHPLRGDYALTYAADAPRGTMFGYLNVFLAAGFMLTGMADADLIRILEERDRTSVSVDENGITWRGHRLSHATLRELRALLMGFGSCSFSEPVEELDGLFA